jgi:hypothetical protein
MPYKGRTYVAWPRRGCRELHRYNGLVRSPVRHGTRATEAWGPRHRSGLAGSHRIGFNRIMSRHGAKKELPCKGEPMLPVADDVIVTSAYSPVPMRVWEQEAVCQAGSTPTDLWTRLRNSQVRPCLGTGTIPLVDF